MQCQNNLKQIGLAIHNYHDTYKSLPMASMMYTKYYSAFTAILPYLENENLSDIYDPSLSAHDPANAEAVETQVPTYLCPSMVLPRRVPEKNPPGSSNPESGAPGSYAVCVGTEYPWSGPRNGAFTFHTDPSTEFRSILDGLSNTFFVGELDFGLEDYKWRGTDTLKYGATQWGIGYNGYSIATTCGVFNSDRLITAYREFVTFRSDHVGGCNFLYGDGAVRFLSDVTDAEVLDAMATRQGGETNANP